MCTKFQRLQSHLTKKNSLLFFGGFFGFCSSNFSKLVRFWLWTMGHTFSATWWMVLSIRGSFLRSGASIEIAPPEASGCAWPRFLPSSHRHPGVLEIKKNIGEFPTHFLGKPNFIIFRNPDWKLFYEFNQSWWIFSASLEELALICI